MKKTFLISLSACVAIALAAISFNGCKPSSSEAPKAKPGASAEKNSFNEVTSKLDAGGNVYLYLSTEQLLDGVSGKISSWRTVFAGIPGASANDLTKMNKAFDVVTQLISDSGIEDVSGFGLSSIATDKSFYHSKAVLHHYKGKGNGFLWTVFGDKPHALTGLDLLPATTAVASFSDCNVAEMWSVIKKEIEQSGIPEAKEFLDKIPERFEHKTQMNWEKVVASLGGEAGFVLTLDDSKMVPVPLPGSPGLEVPEPGLMLFIKIKDDTIFNRVDAELKKNEAIQQMVVSTDNGNLKMRTVALPLPLPMEVRPSIATAEGYLILASSDSLIKEALAVKAGQKPGLKSSEEFKRVSKNIPQQGNQFSYVSQRFGQTLIKVQQQALEATAAGAAKSQWLKSFLNPDSAGSSYAVSANTDEGWMVTANGNKNPATIAAASVVAVPAVLAGMALPALAKAKQKAQRVKCTNNLRQLELAKQMWATEKNKTDAATPTESDLHELIGIKPLVCPQGGSYTIGSVGESARCSVHGQLPK